MLHVLLRPHHLRQRTIITSFSAVAPGPFQSIIETYLVFMQNGTPEVDIQFKVRTYVQ